MYLIANSEGNLYLIFYDILNFLIYYFNLNISLYRSIKSNLSWCDTKCKDHFCLFLHHFEVFSPSSSVCDETAFLSLDQHYFHALAVWPLHYFFSTVSLLLQLCGIKKLPFHVRKFCIKTFKSGKQK